MRLLRILLCSIAAAVPVALSAMERVQVADDGSGFVLADSGNKSEWKRAYSEINDFEDQLVRHGIVLCKFWMHITKDEQIKRFERRKKQAHKKWKLTDEDWRNREKWDEYEVAVNEMVERTSTTRSPWTLVEANDKKFARIKVLETICEQLEAKLEEVKSRNSF